MIKKYFAMAVAALAIVGCSNEDDILNNETANELVSIASVAVDGQTTRAINAENKLVDASLHLFITDSDAKYNANGELWEHTLAEGWKFSDMSIIDDLQAYWKGGTVTWRAASIDKSLGVIHPDYNPELTIVNVFPNESSLDVYDLLWGMGTSTTNDLDITLQHAFSKITVNINKGTAFDGDIQKVGVYNCIHRFYNKVNTANSLSEVATPVPGSTSDITLCKLTTAPAGYAESYSGIFVPQSFDANKFVISIHSTTSGVVYKYTAETPVTFEAGKAYTLNLQAAQDKVLAGSITASSWTPVDAGTLETE